MHRSDMVSLSSVEFPEAESNIAFNVVIMYEEIEAGKLAKRACDSLIQNIGLDHGFTQQFWKFDALSIPVFQEAAGRDAARADFVVVSSQAGELPGPVLAWLQTWLEQAATPLALVALFDPGSETLQANAVRDFLSSLAERGGVEFFAPPSQQTDGSLERRDYSSPSQSDPHHRVWIPSIVQDEDYRGVTHWGINE
jgi:hypothetical protein